MRHKVLVLVSLLLVLSLGFTVVAEAAQIERTGRVWAKEAGYARIKGDGVVNIAGHGAATVWINGADTLRAIGEGRRWDLPEGTGAFPPGDWGDSLKRESPFQATPGTSPG